MEDGDDPGLWTSFATALQLIVGWFCVAIGVLNLLAEVDRTGAPDLRVPPLPRDALRRRHRVARGEPARPRPGRGRLSERRRWSAAAGVLVTSVPVTTTVCCMSGFTVRHGYPFTFLARNEGLGEAGRWHVDSQHLLADLLFWGYAGLLVLVAVTLFRRARRRREPASGREPPVARASRCREPQRGSPGTSATHAEHLAHAEEATRQAEPRRTRTADDPPTAAVRAVGALP